MTCPYREHYPTGADSDQFARLFRSDFARDSDFKSPTIPISNRPGKRFFQHVDFLTFVSAVGQPFFDCLARVRRMLVSAFRATADFR